MLIIIISLFRISMSSKSAKKKRFVYSPSKMQDAVRAVRDGMKLCDASKQFMVPTSTLHNKVSEKSPIASHGHSGMISFLGEKAEEQLVQWIIGCAKMGFPCNKNSLLLSVKQIVTELNLKTPFKN